MPPVLAVQVHIHDDEPSAVTAEAVPVLHNPVVGAELMVSPLDEPQAPSVTVPPLEEPLPEELLLEPEELPPLELEPDELPLDELPLDALETARFAPQSTALPPPVPWQIQVHGPLPEMGETVPELHRFEVGAALIVVLLAEPQVPLMAVVCSDAAH